MAVTRAMYCDEVTLSIQVTYLSCASGDRHVPKRSIVHTFVLQRNGDFIYLLLSVECFNRWWIIFNDNVLGSPRYGASAHALLITR